MLSQDQLDTCKSYNSLCRLLNLPVNGSSHLLVRKLIEDNKLSISHFTHRRTYPLIEKECPICKSKFETSLGSPKEKITCSYSCSNTYFRSGNNNSNTKDLRSVYRAICLKHHHKKCIICGEEKIIEVHHIDKNRSNNQPSNLVPLCPTHHKYIHSKYSNEVEPVIRKYINNWLQSFKGS